MTPFFESTSEAQTRAFASELATQLAAGAVLLLSGDLGAGKTAFVKGLAHGLGIDEHEVTSPTFTLVHEYRNGRLPLVHVDLYRLERIDFDELGVDPDLAGAGVVAIEWPDRLTRELRGALHVRITDLGGDRRAFHVTEA